MKNDVSRNFRLKRNYGRMHKKLKKSPPLISYVIFFSILNHFHFPPNFHVSKGPFTRELQIQIVEKCHLLLEQWWSMPMVEKLQETLQLHAACKIFVSARHFTFK